MFLLTTLLVSGGALAQFEPTNALGGVNGTELQQRTGNAVQGVCGQFVNQGVDETRDDVELQNRLFARCGEMVHTNNRLLNNGGPVARDLGINAEELNSALQNIAGEEIAAAGSLATESAVNHSDFVSSRFAAVLSRVSTLQVSSLNMGGNRKLILAASDSDGEDSELAGEIPFGIYLNANGGVADREFTDGEDGFDGDSNGITIGADYRVGANSIVGAAVGYESNNVEFTLNNNVSGGGLESEQANITGYVLIFEDNRFMDMVAGVGFGSYELERQIVILDSDGDASTNTFNETAVANPDSNSFRFSVGGGYEFAVGESTFAPFARFSSLNLTIDEYTETGAQELDLRVNEQKITSLTLGVGARFVRPISTKSAIILPQLSFEWTHEFKDNERQIVSSYVHDPRNNPLTLVTDVPDRDYFTVGAGVSSVLSSGLQLYLDGKALLGLEKITHGVVSAGLRYEF